ncbi:hypothetical protein, partial [Propionibacterium freudenreichii]|uniref:hypothetical protein n=1 Tax=Propionibacterium freudenreichii TaxID=1744 RepID=UPI0038544389
AKRQTLMFSATCAPEVEVLAQALMKAPERIDLRAGPDDPFAVLPDIHQRAIQVDVAQRTPLLRHLIAQEGWSRVLVFVA